MGRHAARRHHSAPYYLPGIKSKVNLGRRFETGLEAAVFYAIYSSLRPPVVAAPMRPPDSAADAAEARVFAEARRRGLVLERSTTNMTGFRGVWYDGARAPNSRYVARYNVDCKPRLLGRFGTPAEAALCYAVAMANAYD